MFETMSACTVQLSDNIPEARFERECPTCRLKIVNQFVAKCPRCATKLSLAELCVGCFQNGACHGESATNVAKPLVQRLPPK
jgi:hypothetical protein